MFRSVDVDPICIMMINVEKLEFVDELPVTSQVSVGGSTEPRSLGISEMSLHVDEGRYTPLLLVFPYLAHEGPIKVGASFHDRVDGLVADELSEDLSLGGAIEYCGEDARTCQSA